MRIKLPRACVISHVFTSSCQTAWRTFPGCYAHHKAAQNRDLFDASLPCQIFFFIKQDPLFPNTYCTLFICYLFKIPKSTTFTLCTWYTGRNCQNLGQKICQNFWRILFRKSILIYYIKTLMTTFSNTHFGLTLV